MQIRYVASAAEPSDHRGEFAIDLDGVTEPSLDLVLPAWVPGSYHILPYSRTFGELKAVRPSDGRPLPVARVDKARWRVSTQGESRVRVEYSVYGHDLVTEGFDLTPEHLLLNAGLCLPYADGHRSEPVEVELKVPADWTVVTELAPVEGAARRFSARDYDELVDQPIDAGTPIVVTIRPKGIPHRIVLCGEGGNYELARLEEDLAKIVTSAIDLVGGTPLTSYTFFYHLTDRPDGGLEHASSNSCVIARTAFRPKENYLRFLDLTSHEYFHLYNVKRILPKAFQPFDYTREVYTRLLWWMEGSTDYFGYLVLRRAGLVTPAQYLEHYAKGIKRYLETPGRRISLEDASFLSWIDHYQPYEETPNRSISYYLKGELVTLALDLEIRHATENRASVETVLRTLWTEYGAVGRGLQEDELLLVANRATGLDLGGFFARYVSGSDDLDFDAVGRHAGLSFGPKPKPPDDDTDDPGYLGLTVEDSGGVPRVRVALSGGPGRRAGLTPGDEIVALDGVRVRYDGFEKALGRYPAGSPVELAIFRRGYLRRVTVTTGPPPPEKYAFRQVADPDPIARRVYEGWLGVPWEPDAKKDGTPAP